ncbi:Vitamin B12 transporter BtuB [Alteriqipengyuania sp. 357]
MRCYFLLGAATCALAIPVSASAQSNAPSKQASATPASSQAQSSEADETIIVTAPFQRREDDLLQGTSVVTGETLQRELRPTLGETLARQPGVSATSFGPNASRPILRGFQGERIRVLTDGIGSIDVSNTSVDHPVVIDPLLADRIEVLRGPSALLFGSSAIGGVVNVIDKRIPRTIPENGYSVDGTATYGSASNERSVAGAANAAIGGKFVVHADGSYTKTDDLRIPGYVLSPEARAQALATAALPQPAPDPDSDEEPIDFAANAALRDRLPNTAYPIASSRRRASFTAMPKRW